MSPRELSNTMDKDKKISLFEVYHSLQTAIESLKRQHYEINELVGTVQEIKHFVEKVLKPICRYTSTDRVTTIEGLNVLLSRHKSRVNASIAGATSNKHSSCWGEDASTCDQRHKLNMRILPPVVAPTCTEFAKPRPPPSTGVRYPALNPAFTRNSTVSRRSPRIGSPLLKVTPPSHMLPSDRFSAEEHASDLHESLHRYVEKAEHETIKLQEIFLHFSQKVVVPLKAFCKPSRFPPLGRFSKTHRRTLLNDPPKRGPRENEFIIDETMKQIRVLLWPPRDGVQERMFSQEGISEQIFEEIDCATFEYVRVIPDILQKFERVLACATTWLKLDELFTEKAKCGYNRVHRRYLKTEKMWKEARQEHRQLTTQHEFFSCRLQSNQLRLDTLRQDLETFKEDLGKCDDHRLTLEIKLKNNTDSVDHLRACHVAIRKRISVLERKIETRERNYEYMESRIRSMETDQNALCEKLKINEEFSSSIRAKLIKLFKDREAWKRRYQEKTDPEILRNKLDGAGVRVPFPTVREKTFILRSRVDNLRLAIAVITDTLQSRDWTVLCKNLPWTSSWFSVICPKDQQSPTEGNDSTSHSHSNQLSCVTSPNKIISYVKSRNYDDEKEHCSLMLHLWLRYSDNEAKLEQLLNALHASHMSDIASRVKQFPKRLGISPTAGLETLMKSTNQ